MTGQNHNGWPVLLYEYGTVVGALMPALTLVLVWSVVIKVGVEWVDQDHLRHKAPGGGGGRGSSPEFIHMDDLVTNAF